MNVNDEPLRIEILLSQPAPSLQDDLSPRRSPVVGMGFYDPGAPHAESQSTEREVTFPLQANLDGCISPEQERTTTVLLKTDVEVDDVETTTTTSAQAAASEKFARPLTRQQQQRMTAWGDDQTKQFDPGEKWSTPFLFRCIVCPYVLFSCVCLFSWGVFVCIFFPQAGTRGKEIFRSRMRVIRMRELDG